MRAQAAITQFFTMLGVSPTLIFIEAKCVNH
jgi:hypothetical protein